MIKKFEEKVCIVTGGGQGIGGGIARKFAQQGSKVMIADINESAAKQNKNTIESLGGIAQTVHTDVSKSKDIENMVNATISEWGRIDFLIQNTALNSQPGLIKRSYCVPVIIVLCLLYGPKIHK